MFLFIDESEDGGRKVVGGILLPIEKVPEFEKRIVEERIKSKLFGELKWQSISGAKYHKAYLDVLSLFWEEGEATFHSCSYARKPDRYKAAYMLIRAVTWKIHNHYGLGNTPPLYILFDDGGAFGARSFPKIKEIIDGDSRFRHQVDFCNHGHSHIMGCLLRKNSKRLS